MEEENPWKLGGSDFFMQKKEEYMRRALELARKGEGHTSPNQRFHARGLYRRSGLSDSKFILFRSPCPEDLFAFSAHMIAQTFCKCNLFLRASRFELQSQTLLLQPTHPRHPHGTQEILLRAAPFLT